MSVRYPTICLSASLTYEEKMKKVDVITYFGSVGNVAKALGTSAARGQVDQIIEQALVA